MSVPIYRHPTMTVLVDDSASFLRSLSFQLHPDLPRIAFHNAHCALEWVRQQNGPDAHMEGMLSASVDTYPGASQRHAVALDIEQIYQISNWPQRFRTPSVLVVDYSMPQMNGVEFCEALRDLPCKKILLTGTADENVAVAAFNRGLINRYIRKSGDDALEQLEREILDLQLEFFMDRSQTMRGILALQDYSFITDPAVGVLIAQLSERYQIVEHYLFANPGGFLLYDRNAKPRLLIIETEQGMNAHYEVALDNKAPASMLAALKERQILPDFSRGDGMYAPEFADRWHRYCQPARRIEGRQIFYSALFDLGSDTCMEEVLPSADFLREEARAL
jgi:CheY-like chemotaxis protein